MVTAVMAARCRAMVVTRVQAAPAVRVGGVVVAVAARPEAGLVVVTGRAARAVTARLVVPAGGVVLVVMAARRWVRVLMVQLVMAALVVWVALPGMRAMVGPVRLGSRVIPLAVRVVRVGNVRALPARVARAGLLVAVRAAPPGVVVVQGRLLVAVMVVVVVRVGILMTSIPLVVMVVLAGMQEVLVMAVRAARVVPVKPARMLMTCSPVGRSLLVSRRRR